MAALFSEVPHSPIVWHRKEAGPETQLREDVLRRKGSLEESVFSLKVAEREGFEPSRGCYPSNGLANRRLKPLGHLSMGLNEKVKLLTTKSKISSKWQTKEKDVDLENLSPYAKVSGDTPTDVHIIG